jgi:ATP-dependent RNA helicase RhlE
MKRDADKLARQLVRDGLSATAIHGDRSQSERSQALDEFKTGKVKLLVATDVAARGIDIDQLPFVINYEIPNTPEDYVHRIGRTGRAGSPGEAISLVSPEEMDYLTSIEKLLKREITRLPLPLLGGERETRPPREREVSSHSRGAHAGSAAAAPLTDEERRERSEQRRVREAKDSGRTRRAPYQAGDNATPPPASPYPHFDFSKPYEPPAKPASIEPVAAAAAPPTSHRPPVRSVGALLGRKKSG